MSTVSGDKPEKSTAIATSEKGQVQPYEIKHYLQSIPQKKWKSLPQSRCKAKQGSPLQLCKVCRDKGLHRQSDFLCLSCPDQPAFCRTRDCFVNYHKKMGYSLLTIPLSSSEPELQNFQVKSLKCL